MTTTAAEMNALIAMRDNGVIYNKDRLRAILNNWPKSDVADAVAEVVGNPVDFLIKEGVFSHPADYKKVVEDAIDEGDPAVADLCKSASITVFDDCDHRDGFDLMEKCRYCKRRIAACLTT